MSNTTQQEQLDEVQDRKIEQQTLSAAQQEAVQEVTENANLLRELRRAGIDSRQHDMLEDVLGPETAAAHAIGNRSSDYEQQIKWGSIGKAMQTAAERTPGRLCRGERLAIAQGVHNRDDKSTKSVMTTDEKRKLSSAYEAVANFKSLSAAARGLKTVGETTVTAKREVTEESKSLRERAGAVLD